jgi:cold shock CspA family protein
MKKGYVVSFNSVKAWGFIREFDVRAADIFFHVNSVENRISLRIGDTVLFDAIPSKTKPDKQEAINIRLAKRGELPIADAPAKTAVRQ